MQVADKIRLSGNEASVFANALAVLGRQADSLFPAFQDGFAQVAASAREAGQVTSESLVKELARLNTEIERTTGVFKTGFTAILGVASTVFNRVTGVITQFYASLWPTLKLLDPTSKLSIGERWNAFQAMVGDSVKELKQEWNPAESAVLPMPPGMSEETEAAQKKAGGVSRLPAAAVDQLVGSVDFAGALPTRWCRPSGTPSGS